MNKIKEFIKKELVLIVSFLLCIGSMLFVKPSLDYLGYIDFRTLGLLLSLMAIMAGLSSIGVFESLARALLSKARTVRQLYIALVLLCFFSSMVITNDVALITFVPFTIIILGIANQQNRLIYIVVMETVAANLGSMLTPIGNPQNLYLFSNFDMSFGDFFLTILPYSALSLVLLALGALFCPRDEVSVNTRTDKSFNKRLIAMYVALFLVALFSVFKVVDYRLLLVVVVVLLLAFDRKTFAKVDYSLLLTFVFLFVFIGNLGNISAVSDELKRVVVGNEVEVGVLASQVFSNVPACLLLSGFTADARALLVGVNLGGLGTLIASMASLISFKFVQKESVSSAKYIVVFSGVNILFLALNMLLWKIL